MARTAMANTMQMPLSILSRSSPLVVKFGNLMAWNASLRLLVYIRPSGTLKAALTDIAGPCTAEDWLDLVKPNIITRMDEYEEGQIEFSILSLGRDPLPDLIDQLAVNVKSLESLRQQIASHNEGAQDADLAHVTRDNTILGPDDSYGLTGTRLDQVRVPQDLQERYQRCSVAEACHYLHGLGCSQQALRMAIREEQESHQADDDYAMGRRYDYGPAVRTWVRFLARKRMIEDLVT